MDRLFVLQLIVSFFVGGAATAALTFFAERVSDRFSGIVLGIPTTFAIGMFFVAWTLSSEVAVSVLPTAPVTLSIAYIFLVLYIGISSMLRFQKFWTMIIAYIISISVWCALSLMVILGEFADLRIGLLIWLVCVSVSTWILETWYRRLPSREAIIVRFSAGETIFRSILAGTIITVVVLIAKTLGPFWGAVFSMFPAALSSGIIILHHRYDTSFLIRSYHLSPVGTSSILLYAIVAMWTYSSIGFVSGTVVAYLATLLYVWMFKIVLKSLGQ